MKLTTHTVPRLVGLFALAVTAAAVGLTAAPASASGSDQGPATTGQISVGERPTAAPSGETATKGRRGSLPSLSPESVIGADGRTKVTDTTTYPARAIGQIEFIQNNQGFICTGWLIDKNSILTSGHCSFTPDGGTGDPIEFATFSAGRNRLVDPFGTCSVYEVFSTLGWKRDGLPQDDWSVMQLGTNSGATCDIGTTVGWFGLSWTPGADALTGDAATVQGYPGDKANGTQWTMSGSIKKSTKQMVFYRMDTAGGQSGSPVFDPTGPACGNTPCGMAVHSYGVGLPGAGATANAGPRITEARFTAITNYAATNG